MANIPNLFEQVNANLTAKFTVDGTTYSVKHFSISFDQEVDFKGQPQQETHGGQIQLTFSQMMFDHIAQWAKEDTMRKTGEVIFSSETSGAVLTVLFEDAYCVAYSRRVNINTGSETHLVIAPGAISLNGVTINKIWRE